MKIRKRRSGIKPYGEAGRTLNLRNSEDTYPAIFENINDAIIIIDCRTKRIVDCNRSAEKMLGRSRKDMISLTVDKLHPKDAVSRAMGLFRTLALGGRGSVESELVRRNGKRIPVEIKGTVLKHAERKLLLGVFRDITERISTDNRLKSSEDKFRKLFEYAKVGAVVVTLQGRIIHANRSFCSLLGYSEDELIGKNVIAITYRDDVKASSLLLDGLHKRADKYAEIKKRYIRKDGSLIWAETSVTVFHDYDDEKEYALAQILDITERKASADRQRESEERYKALTEMAEDPIYVLDKRGIISYVNSFGAAYFNKKPSDLVGHSLPNLFGSKVAKRLVDNIARVYKTGKSVFAFGEFEFHGSKFWLDTRLSPITDSSGNVINVMGVSRDVTSHRRAEEILERDKRELEKLVKSNSQKLLDTQKKLYRQERLAEMGTLSASVAHELRSPLAAIGIAAYNIKTKSKDHQLDNNIRNIEVKVMEADHIIKNLLIFSGIKSPIFEPAKIYDLLNNSIDLVQSIFPEYEVKIRRRFDCPPDLVLYADAVQLQEVFNNILNNSFESFTGKAGEIDVAVSERKGDWLKIVFKDNGPGIGKETLETAFEPFSTTKAGGTGLGLPVCKQIIDLHKGTIEISGKPGSGTSVTIHLPIRNAVRGA